MFSFNKLIEEPLDRIPGYWSHSLENIFLANHRHISCDTSRVCRRIWYFRKLCWNRSTSEFRTIMRNSIKFVFFLIPRILKTKIPTNTRKYLNCHRYRGFDIEFDEDHSLGQVNNFENRKNQQMYFSLWSMIQNLHQNLCIYGSLNIFEYFLEFSFLIF